MTMTASRANGADNIKVQITYGPVTASVEEHYGHLRSFHKELGRLLDEVEADKADAATT